MVGIQSIPYSTSPSGVVWYMVPSVSVGPLHFIPLKPYNVVSLQPFRSLKDRVCVHANMAMNRLYMNLYIDCTYISILAFNVRAQTTG